MQCQDEVPPPAPGRCSLSLRLSAGLPPDEKGFSLLAGMAAVAHAKRISASARNLSSASHSAVLAERKVIGPQQGEGQALPSVGPPCSAVVSASWARCPKRFYQIAFSGAWYRKFNVTLLSASQQLKGWLGNGLPPWNPPCPARLLRSTSRPLSTSCRGCHHKLCSCQQHLASAALPFRKPLGPLGVCSLDAAEG